LKVNSGRAELFSQHELEIRSVNENGDSSHV
jgi:hypothetical protein